jgi:hypothetical protein
MEKTIRLKNLRTVGIDLSLLGVMLVNTNTKHVGEIPANYSYPA